MRSRSGFLRLLPEPQTKADHGQKFRHGVESTPVWSGVQISSENRSAAEIQIELEEKLTSLLGTPITLG
jgi:hypothetical protein